MAAPYPAQTAAKKAQDLAVETAGLLQMFTDPPAHDLARLAAARTSAAPDHNRADTMSLTWGNPPDNSNLLPAQEISRVRIESLWTPIVAGPASVYHRIPPQTIDIYLQMLCHYVNKRQNRAPRARRRWRSQPADIPIVAHLPCTFYTARGLPAGSGAYPAGHPWYTAASAELTSYNYSPDRILQMKHIFLPIRLPRGQGLAVSHEILIVISPIAKSIQYLSSLASEDYPRPEYIIKHIAHLLAIHLGRGFCPKQWKIKWGESSKEDHPNHSGLWVTSNAMRIAFGFTLNDVGSGRDYENRRRKMAVELLNGDFDLTAPRPDRRPYYHIRPAARPYLYSMVNMPPKFSRPNDGNWLSMDRAWIKRFLPASHKLPARSWKAQNETKASLRAKCRREKVITLTGAMGSRSRFYGSRRPAAGSLDDFKDWFERRVIADGRPYPM